MRCFRSHRRLCGTAALFALTFQIVMSFGHVHGFEANLAAPAIVADIGVHATPDAPQGDKDHQDADQCGCCAILSLLNGAETASAPLIASPIALASGEAKFAAEAALIEARRAAFQSRGPPLS